MSAEEITLLSPITTTIELTGLLCQTLVLESELGTGIIELISTINPQVNLTSIVELEDV